MTVRATFRGGPEKYQGVHRLERTPDLLVLTMGDEHYVYARDVDPDTLKFTDSYTYVTTRYGTPEAVGLEAPSDDDCCPCSTCVETIGYDPAIPCPHCPKHPNGRTP